MFGRSKKKHQETTTLVCDITQEFLTKRGIEQPFTLDNTLSQTGIGLDSIGRMELFAELERRCQVQIPERHWEAKTMTLRQLVKLINKGR